MIPAVVLAALQHVTDHADEHVAEFVRLVELASSLAAAE